MLYNLRFQMHCDGKSVRLHRNVPLCLFRCLRSAYNKPSIARQNSINELESSWLSIVTANNRFSSLQFGVCKMCIALCISSPPITYNPSQLWPLAVDSTALFMHSTVVYFSIASSIQLYAHMHTYERCIWVYVSMLVLVLHRPSKHWTAGLIEVHNCD